MRATLLTLALSLSAAGSAGAQDPRIAPVLPYGQGLPGSGGIVPKLGTAGGLPRVGNHDFAIRLTEGLGGVRWLIAVSLDRAEHTDLGMTLYGDFLTPGRFFYWFVDMSGGFLLPGQGTGTLSVPVPDDPSLVGTRFYWQGFVGDFGSPSAIAHSNTAGLQITVVL